VPVSLTLKNIPDDVYARLKTSAQEHRRSLNKEAIVCLESALSPARPSVAQRLEYARLLRAELGGATFLADDIDTLKREGRP
jgi:antitoxin FitA